MKKKGEGIVILILVFNDIAKAILKLLQESKKKIIIVKLGKRE